MAQCPECGRRAGEDTGGPICLSHQGTGSADAQEWAQVGPKGLWASAMPLFLYKGPLTCTSPERGASLGPRVCVGTGNLQATGSLQGYGSYFHPHGLGGSWPRGMVVSLALHV